MKKEKEVEVDGFLNVAERSALLQAIKEISDVGFTIVDRDTKVVLSEKNSLSDHTAFFAKAKLWRVVQSIVRTVFMGPLVAGHLSFTDGKGERYYFSRLHPSFQQHVQ